MFGQFVRDIRIKKRIGLREFCLKSGMDASNWSKIEREVLPPPKDPQGLEMIANNLEMEKGTDEWMKLFDLASLDRGKLPEDIMNDKELLKNLPVFFRTIRGQKPSEKELRDMVEIIRRS